MVEFVPDSLIMSVPSGSGIFVIDSDLQGSWATGEQKYFNNEYPRVYEQYVKTCYFDRDNRVGTAMLCEEDGYKIAILFTKKHRSGKGEDIQKNFQDALLDLFRLIPSDVYLYSPILGRTEGCFPEYHKTINRLLKDEAKSQGTAPRKWWVYAHKGYGNAFNF